MNLNQEIIKSHTQLFEYSCIPMAVELVLKLLGRVPPDYFELQTQWNNFRFGTFADYDAKTINGVTFQMQFSVESGRNFSPEKMQQLFGTIDRELGAGRYVIISLASNGGWHNFVIYDRTNDGEYQAVSKTVSGTTWHRSDVKQKVADMTGTDVLTYRLSDQPG
jgi:hypothetical protein